MTHGGGGTFCHNFISLTLTAWERNGFEDWEEKDDSISESMSDEGVCRTAPATPGLLITSQTQIA